MIGKYDYNVLQDQRDDIAEAEGILRFVYLICAALIAVAILGCWFMNGRRTWVDKTASEYCACEGSPEFAKEKRGLKDF